MKADKSNNYAYNKNLQPLAKKLRANATKSEACLWKYVLSAARMKGYQFRRQRPIINYIVDFICLDLMLIIEVDGITHHDEKAQIKDQIRTDELENAGFTVIRFDDEDVLNDINSVYHVIQEAIVKLESTP